MDRLKMREWEMRDRQKRNARKCGTGLAFPENVVYV